MADRRRAPVDGNDGASAPGRGNRKVAEAEGKYRQTERNDNGSVVNIIAARDAYEQALRDWQAQYPEEAAKSHTVNYNDGATNNPWNR